LTNFQEIDDPLKWEVGRHGIEIDFTINGREFGSTFLPEVAVEEGWDPPTTLEFLVEKAGFKKGFDKVKDVIKARTYESLKNKMSYDEYV
jgi:AMMECR1 domain-containing protein